MTLSAGLDSGLAFGVVVVFFCFLYPGWSWLANLQWWGTRVYKEVISFDMLAGVRRFHTLIDRLQGCDWQACPYRTLAPGEHFG